MLGTTVLAVDPQWWWSTVFLPAAGGIGWLLKYWYDDQQARRADKHADRSDTREEQNTEWTQIKETNVILTSQVAGLEAKVQQFDPTLAKIQTEFRDGMKREMEGLERERDLRLKLVDLEALNADLLHQLSDAQHENLVLRENMMGKDTLGEGMKREIKGLEREIDLKSRMDGQEDTHSDPP